MLVSDYILKFLYQKKVKDVFLLTGGAASFIVDAFSKQNKIMLTCYKILNAPFISALFSLMV